MEYNEILSFDIDTASVQRQAKAAADAMEGLKQAAVSLRAAMTRAFSGTAWEDGAAGAEKAASSLSSQLFQLQMNLGKLKAAISAAAVPIALAFLPAVNQGIRGAARFIRTVGAVLAALLGGAEGTRVLTEGTEEASEAQKTLTKTSTAAGKAVKRALAGFDELEILKFSDTGSSTAAVTVPDTGEIPLPPIRDTITPSMRALVERILALLAPLKQIDFSPAAEAFQRLGQAVLAFGNAAVQGLEWAWFQILTPLAGWVIEKAVPASVDALTAAFSALTAVFVPVQAGLQGLLAALQPVFTFLAGAAITALGSVETLFDRLARTFTERSGVIQSALAGVAAAVTALWTRLEPVFRNWMTVFEALFTYLGGLVTTWAGLLTDAFCGITVFLSGVFTGDWSRAWDGITAVFAGAKQAIASQVENLMTLLAAAWPAMASNASLALSRLADTVASVFGNLPGTVKGAVNGIIGFVNGMIQAVTGGINALLRAVNGVRFDIPSWVPGLGGKSFGMNLSYVSAPKIPYLAQGAVLPANKPFLAVVGDQNRGTNVEAPLATIQQAVAAVLGEGQQTQAALLRQILQAVLGIEVGDTVIGQAAERYRRKMAVVTGGMT